jgi:uncharacterized protein
MQMDAPKSKNVPLARLSRASNRRHIHSNSNAQEGASPNITEGEFRLVNRKIANGPLPYIPLGPRHRFLRADAEPLVPGQPTEVAFSLFPTSVVLNKGHRIRLAIAGADASMFQHCPAGGPPR